MHTKLWFALMAVGLLGGWASVAEAVEPNQWPLRRAMVYNWHANYAHLQYGQPVAMVVPPTANLQTQWSWGV
ncbi:MAG: hypothetical protein AAGG46_02745, partial [Planctomycetota bacterium]